MTSLVNFYVTHFLKKYVKCVCPTDIIIHSPRSTCTLVNEQTAFHNYICREHFQLILRYLHFCINPEPNKEAPEDPPHKIRMVLDHLNHKMLQYTIQDRSSVSMRPCCYGEETSFFNTTSTSVSYTHLDVYKRQEYHYLVFIIH